MNKNTEQNIEIMVAGKWQSIIALSKDPFGENEWFAWTGDYEEKAPMLIKIEDIRLSEN